MNDPVSHEQLERAYLPFSRDHEQSRQELLRAISELEVTPHRLQAKKRRNRIARVMLSLAAVLLVAVTLGLTFWPSATSPAAAIIDVRQRLLGVESLHLKGWIYQTIEKDGRLFVERYPHEFYAERPSRYWNNGYGFSFEGNHNLKRVTHSATVSDGERTLRVRHDERLAQIAPVGRLQSQLRTERMLQSKIFDRLVAGLPETYREVGKEEVQGVTCRIFEQRVESHDGHGLRRRLWLNTANATPVRMKAWIIRGSGAEEPAYEYDTIRINAPRPHELFSFEPPAGYQLSVSDEAAPPLTPPTGAVASGGGMSLWAWMALNIDDRAVLFSWWADVPAAAEARRPTPRFTLGPPGAALPCRRIDLRRDARWRWSLLLPVESEAGIGLDDLLTLALAGKTARLKNVDRPLRLPPEMLEQVLREAQQSTLAPDSDAAPFTLNDLREQIRSVAGDE